ncbi:hypothetical protein BTO06_10015 [Tenacibaculum sp. SZ-18]|uniref:hypothetical protein n=1 Tax=Tenacibaculum sp. SZ-18 TaxID=754423 RepID=UPI000C2D56F5|nr:hypothetical protein [Tenacibaculum sp. SZ-18]AUC15456.1 hypothetical protein BTO06_10015 [Tenacibaculum sp. SZ-18]
MKNLGKKLVVVLVVVFGSLALGSCTDTSKEVEELSQQNELQLIEPGNDGTIETEDPEEE